jgi:hypothetical protein
MSKVKLCRKNIFDSCGCFGFMVLSTVMVADGLPLKYFFYPKEKTK